MTDPNELKQARELIRHIADCGMCWDCSSNAQAALELLGGSHD